ncbi:MAG: tRNA (adenosine(37)-N6)-threonylcarbamoyltransferase complex ATPase subunit type 1 TsaE [Phycisphaerales bacterium]|nr:tRNA (adenosine(37)-N6)-threonylcarbamoyltransferase complex ATPase subunit type 1 TsaE [Phycisphaerales bacterium]
MTLQIISQSLAETLSLGRRIGELARPGQVMALNGPLGAGKTQLVRGIAAGAGVADVSLVSSPTYVLLNIYEKSQHIAAAKTVYHLDAYRIASADQFAAAGFEELIEQDGLVVLEWAARVPELLPADVLTITGEVTGPQSRDWLLTAQGEHSQQLLMQLMSA